MKRYIASLLSVFSAIATAQQVSWPPLPESGFMSGRAATKADVEAGRAVFVAAQGEVVIGKPLQIQVPQYAWSKVGTKKQPAIVIQAEEANGQKIVGARLLSGGYIAGLTSDFEFLGSVPPSAATELNR